MLEKMKKAKEAVISQAPLIHCITNPISINDCANVVLALGAKPIMAEHPKEVHEITALAKALAVNLGNITDARAESIFISGGVAKNAQIPCVIDVVGVACSALRMELAQRFIRECAPCVIKGNLSEIKALAGVDNAAQGIDVGQKDSVNGKDTQKLQKTGQLVCSYAKKAHAVAMASGAVDIISDGSQVWFVKNGVAELSKVTGTGCMLNVITATYLSVTDPLTACLLSAGMLGICGELADKSRGMGTYHIELINQLSTLSDAQLEQYLQIQRAL